MAAFGLVVALTLPGCSAPTLATDAPIVVASAALTAPTAAARGQILSVEAFATAPELRGRAVRATYVSSAPATGVPTMVSGAFFVPDGEPPPTGWPVIAFAHGTTGLTAECGPSAHPDLLGYLDTARGLVNAGYAVAATDYEGLGAPGVHHYLEPRSAAYNVIDSVRALRHLDPSVGQRWLAYGASQGGQAAWAANEFARDYGTGLELVGSVAVAPAVNLSAVASAAYTEALSAEQLAVMPMVVEGVRRFDPNLPVDRLLHGAAATMKSEIIGCGPQAGGARAQVHPADVKPDDEAATDALRTALRKMALPQQPLSAPLLVVNGLADETIYPSWISEAIERSCALSGSIRHVEEPGIGHSDQAPYEQIMSWMQDRFAARPTESTCS